jgi:hypothetical protein
MMYAANRPMETTVQGIVSPAGWDDHDNVNRVCIATDNDRSYFVDLGSQAGRTLTSGSYLKRSVEVTGKVFRIGGREVILVSRFRGIGEAPEEQ